MSRVLTQVADATPYNNATAGLAAVNVRSAIDEIAGSVNPSKSFVFYEDFCSGDYTSSYSWLNNSSGTGANLSVGDPNTIISNTHQGVLRAFTGTTATGRAVCYVNVSNMILGGGETKCEFDIYMSTLSTSAQRFVVRVGLGDTNSGADHVSGVYFSYSDNLSSGNWTGKTASSSTRTVTDTGVAAVTGWTRLTYVINSAGTSVQYYVNGVASGTPITTNIPTAATDWVTPMIKVTSSVGTTSKEINIDYFYLRQLFNVSR